MAMIPAYCDHCGALFASRAFKITSAVTGLTLDGNEEDCPSCGQLAKIVDGTFDVTNGALELISGPTITKEMLARFANLVDLAARNEISADELQKRAGEVNQALGDVVSQIRAKSPTWIPILILLSMFKSCTLNVEAKVDLNKLFDQLSSKHGGIVYTPQKAEGQKAK